MSDTSKSYTIDKVLLIPSEGSSLKEDTQPNFEVESIELASPELFSESDINFNSQEEKLNEPTIFENIETKDDPMMESNNNVEQKEPEMFDKLDTEEDYEIPAFLRKQKN